MKKEILRPLLFGDAEEVVERVKVLHHGLLLES
jgi:hypothetical protein